jgi:hypothetical protein
MLTWLIRGVVTGAVVGVSYVVGRRRGGRAVAREMASNPTLGRQVIDRLARIHGVVLSDLFETDDGDAGPAT